MLYKFKTYLLTYFNSRGIRYFMLCCLQFIFGVFCKLKIILYKNAVSIGLLRRICKYFFGVRKLIE